MDARLQCLLNTNESIVALIDFQARLMPSVGSHRPDVSVANAVKFVKAAKIFGVPVIATMIDKDRLGGPLVAEFDGLLDQPALNRSNVNAWEDRSFRGSVDGYGRKKLVLAGFWTSASICFCALCAAAEGYEVHVLADACGDISPEAHERALQRMIPAGIVPITTTQAIFEWQRDLARKDTAEEILRVAAQDRFSD